MTLQSYGVSAPTYLVSGALSSIFTACVDDCAAKRLTWIRFGANEDIVMVENLSNLSGITWNTANLAVLDSAIDYVVNKGLRAYVYLAPPTYYTAHALMAQANAGATALSLERVDGLQAGQTITVGVGAAAENRVIATIVGTTVNLTAGLSATHAIYEAVSYTLEDYVTLLGTWASFLAARWAGKVGIWQVFNENNVGDFRGRQLASYSAAYNTNFAITSDPVAANAAGNAAATVTNAAVGLAYTVPTDTVPQLSAAYLRDVQVSLAAIRKAIKAHDTQGMVAVNVGARDLPYDALAQGQYVQWFGALAQYCDAIAMDQYDGDATTNPTKVGYLNDLKSQTGLPFYIAEFGWFWSGTGMTEAGQATAIKNEMACYQAANVDGMLLYQYRDEATNPSGYGIVKNTGVHTLGYDAFFNTVAPESMQNYAVTNDLEHAWQDLGGYDNDVMKKARYEQDALAGTYYGGPLINPYAPVEIPAFAPNHFVNGGLELNVRGGGTYDASITDQGVSLGWAAHKLIWNPEATTVDAGSGESLKATGNGVDNFDLFQQVLFMEQYRGQKMTIRARINGSPNLYASISYGTGGASALMTAAGTGTWKTYTGTLTVPIDATMLLIRLSSLTPLANGAIVYFDNIELAVGSSPLPHLLNQPNIRDINRRHRYWNTLISARWRAVAANEVYYVYVPYSTALANATIAPTVTNSNTAPAVSTNVLTATVPAYDTFGATIQLVATAAGDVVWRAQTLIVDGGYY